MVRYPILLRLEITIGMGWDYQSQGFFRGVPRDSPRISELFRQYDILMENTTFVLPLT